MYFANKKFDIERKNLKKKEKILPIYRNSIERIFRNNKSDGSLSSLYL